MIVKRKQKEFGWVGNLFGAKNFQAARNLSNKGAMKVGLAQQATKEGTKDALAAAQKYTNEAGKLNRGAMWEATKGVGKAVGTTGAIAAAPLALGMVGTPLIAANSEMGIHDV